MFKLSGVLAALLALPAFSGPAASAQSPKFDYRQTELPNGLKVITLEDFSCPIVAVHLWYHVGSKDEQPDRNGFAHMFEHMMFRGTDRLGPTDHFDYIRRTGGECNAYTSWDQTVYVQTLPADQLDLALWLEAERMTFLKIDQTAFDTERKVVEEERRLGLNRPYGTVPEKILPKMFPGHPYRWLPIGNIRDLRAASVQDLRDFWTRYYVPNNATLVIVGAVKHDAAQQAARKYFGWIPKYPDPPRVTAREPQPTEAQDIKVQAENAPAPIVGIAFRTVPEGHDDYMPLQMLGNILGGGESSRLYRRIVADEQTAVIAAAAAFSLELDGIFGAGAVLAPLGGDSNKVMATLEEEIAKLRSEPVSAQELTKARYTMLRGVVTDNLTVVSKASALGSAAVLEGDVSRVNMRLDAIRKVSTEDLQRVAKQYLAPEHAYRITVERNLLGMLFGKKNPEENAPITATPETEAPPPGRDGLKRPENFPTTAPVAKAADTKVTPAFETRTLDNGLKVIVVPNNEVPFVTVQLGLGAGGWSESKPGTASMAMGMLTKGTAKHDEGELARELENFAIGLGGSANMDTASVSASCLPEQSDRAVELMAEVVRTPTFPEDEFEKLRRQVRTGLTISSNEPSYVAEREMRRRLYGQHPYARTATGELADLDQLEVEDLAPWWKKFIRPDMATLIFAGDISVEKAVELAKANFGDWKAEGAKPPTELKPPPPPGPTQIYLVDKPGVQCQIRVAQPGMTRQSPDYFVSRVVSGYFGGAFSSRLNETIRVKKGLTYGARGGWSAQRFAGEFEVSTFSKIETTAEAVQAIFDELGRLKQEPPTDDELDKTKSYTLGSFPRDRETPQDVAQGLWLIESQGLPADYFEQLLKGVAGTTREDCVRLAQQAVDPSKMVVVVVGPASQIKEELEKIAPVIVVPPSNVTTPPPAEEDDDDD